MEPPFLLMTFCFATHQAREVLQEESNVQPVVRMASFYDVTRETAQGMASDVIALEMPRHSLR